MKSALIFRGEKKIHKIKFQLVNAESAVASKMKWKADVEEENKNPQPMRERGILRIETSKLQHKL